MRMLTGSKFAFDVRPIFKLIIRSIGTFRKNQSPAPSIAVATLLTLPFALSPLLFLLALPFTLPLLFLHTSILILLATIRITAQTHTSHTMIARNLTIHLFLTGLSLTQDPVIATEVIIIQICRARISSQDQR